MALLESINWRANLLKDLAEERRLREHAEASESESRRAWCSRMQCSTK